MSGGGGEEPALTPFNNDYNDAIVAAPLMLISVCVCMCAVRVCVCVYMCVCSLRYTQQYNCLGQKYGHVRLPSTLYTADNFFQLD